MRRAHRTASACKPERALQVGALLPETPRRYWLVAAHALRGNINAVLRSGGSGCGPRYGALLVVALIVLLGFVAPAFADKSAKDARLPKIGPAPEFTLTTHQGKPLSLRDLRGNVAVVTFIFTACGDTCPILTAKLVAIQRKLAADIKTKVFFTAITVDPKRDTPEVLQRYANAHNADLAHWAFLTGSRAEIDDVTRRYSIYQKQQAKGDVDHTFLTSLIDKEGTLRVQYLGVRFDPQEFSDDLRSLTRE